MANLRRRRRDGGTSRGGRRALSNAKRLQPLLSIDWVEKYHQIVKASDRAIYIQGLRAAGLE
jgi:adenylate cyclase